MGEKGEICQASSASSADFALVVWAIVYRAQQGKSWQGSCKRWALPFHFAASIPESDIRFS